MHRENLYLHGYMVASVHVCVCKKMICIENLCTYMCEYKCKER